MGARGPTDFGDYQIAHLPPPSASVGAARWAAIFRTAHYQRGTWERQRGWDAEAIPCGPFCGVVTGEQRESKDHGSLAAFLHPFAAAGKRMSRRSAKYSRRRQTCRTRVQPAIEEQKTGRRGASPCVVRDRSREKRPAPGARNTFFTSYHKSSKDCNARSAFPAAGHCI